MVAVGLILTWITIPVGEVTDVMRPRTGSVMRYNYTHVWGGYNRIWVAAKKVTVLCDASFFLCRSLNSSLPLFVSRKCVCVPKSILSGNIKCSTWNDPRDDRCRRCGSYAEPNHHHRDDDYPRGDFGRGYDGVDERRSREHDDEFGRRSRSPQSQGNDALDEFGRPMRAKGGGDDDDKKAEKEKAMAESKKKGPTWPPPFNKRSTTYEFDTRSGMFYHAPSNFFYDPKSKLYFGHKTQQYYRYDSEQVPPFQQVKQENEDDGNDKAPTTVSATESKPKIAIALKTKSFDGRKNKSSNSKQKKVKHGKEESTAAAPVVELVKLAPVVTKTELATQRNLHRWSGRQQEVATKTSAKIYRTKTDNKPICLLCRRKFRTVDHLRRHERESEMHQTNMERRRSKIDSSSPNNHAANKSLYMDRAAARRILHGPMDVVPTAGSMAEDVVGTALPSSRPEDALDANNVGHQMLQKLGWKAGEKDEDGTNSSSHLKKDWKRIEDMASAQQQRR
eukprot:CAMPEP_0194035422 /NCGR_PEP_ID=MMETSP0009_2-20130614/7841_1 /TAXON_ID=210454 /ORGANISM="Grammatophora oceanica, Strain CCMP 410" /LENGTH=504 /DNA_ID=CAMNT_0038676761 /DNA_START=532 /DNA_END=2046 /DNA_ORIENTATION=-